MSHPTDIHQLAAWLRLELEPGIGPVHARALIKVFGHASNVYSADMDELRALGSERLASQLAQPLSKLKEMTIEQALRWSEQAENHILTPFHPCYPKRLAELEDAPIVLYVRGNPACLSQESLAIVGARQATADGRERAHGFARMLAERGYCIVSGLAHGIDAAAHRGAMSASREAGMTAAVMGTGVDIVYPLSHRSLADEILKCGGALVSAMRLGTPALPVHFPRRNRIVAGLTMGVLVVGSISQRLTYHCQRGRRHRQRGVCHPREHPLSPVTWATCPDSTGCGAGGDSRRYPGGTRTPGYRLSVPSDTDTAGLEVSMHGRFHAGATAY